MKALLLAGGRGHNMVPFAATRPKPVIPVAGEYLIDRTLRLLKEAGVRHATVVTGHEGEALRSRLEKDPPNNMSLHFAHQGKPGIGNAILSARDRFSPGESFFLVYSDTMTTENIFSVAYQTHCINNEPVAAITHAGSSEKYGAVYLDQETRIRKFIEKPKKQAGLANYVLAGVFVLNSTIFDALDKSGGSMERAIKLLIRKETLRAAIWENEWLDMAYPWDILAANRAIMKTWSEASIHQSVTLSGATVKGSVRIGEGVEISSGAVLEGPAYIGAGSFIGHNALIRPYTSIGPGSVIGQSAELKNCVLFGNVSVGRMCFIGDSVVGENVQLGAGVMTINHAINEKKVSVKVNNRMINSQMTKLGAFIGDDAIVGASNTIAAGTIIKPAATIDHNVSIPSRRRG